MRDRVCNSGNIPFIFLAIVLVLAIITPGTADRSLSPAGPTGVSPGDPAIGLEVLGGGFPADTLPGALSPGEHPGGISAVIPYRSVAADPGSRGVRVLASDSPSGMAWKFRSDLSNSGIYDDGGSTPDGTLLWNFTTGGYVYSSPAVVDGILYIGSDDHNLYAIDASSGVLLWNYTTGRPVRSSPAVRDGVVYFSSDDGNVYALDATDGTLLWNYTISWYPDIPQQEVARSSPTIENGVVYIGGNTAKMTALDAATGSLLWNYTTGSPPFTTGFWTSGPAVANGAVYVGNYDANVYAFNTSDGALLWNFTTGNWVFSSPAVADGIIYIKSFDNNLYALDAETGTVVWNITMAGMLSSPAVANDVVYIGSTDKNIYALDALTGAHRWNFTTAWGVESSPAEANGVVYIGSPDKNIYALDALTGVRLWNFTTGAAVYSSPAVVNGVVYVGSGDGNVYAIGSSTGNPPDGVSSLRAADTEPDSITWNWTDSGSPGFSHVMVFLDGVFRENVTKGIKTYTVTGLSPDTACTIGIRTVGTNGMINQTLVNNTAWTEPAVPPVKGWKYRSDLRNSGEFDDGGTRPGGGLLWRYLTESYYGGDPAVVDGVVYTSGYENILALDATTGAVIWDKPFRIFDSDPAVEDGVVYIRWINNVTALDAATGNNLWTYTTGSLIYSNPALADGIVYIGSNDRNLYALDAADGSLLWNFTTGGEVRSSPAVAHGIVYFGSIDKNLYALDAETGTLLWHVTTGERIESSPAVVDGVVYIGTLDSTFYAFDAINGALLWSGRGMFRPAISNGIVYIQNSPYLLTALDAATGTPVWNYTTSGGVYTSPAVANGVVYTGSYDKNLTALDAFSGEPLFSATLGDKIISDPVIANGKIYVQTYDGYLNALVAFPDHPPASVTGLHVTASPGDRITWAWTDPEPIGFSYVMVFLDGVFRENVTKGTRTWTANGLLPLTTHTIGTRTVGPTDLVNQTWVNNTATTGRLTISYLDPPSVMEGSSAFVLDVYGTGFTAGSVMLWDGESQPTQFLQPGLLRMDVPAELVARSDRVNITISDAGSFSNTAVFSITDNPDAKARKFRSDLDNTGMYDDGGKRPEKRLLWNFTTDASVSSSPAVVDGVVYIGSQDHRLYALDASTGALLWNFDTGELAGFVSSSPAVAQGVVYIGGMRTKVFALDAETGELLWKFKVPAVYTTRASISSSPAVSDGVVYIGNYDGYVYALDTVNGDLLWKYLTGTGYYVFSSPAVEDGAVFVAGMNSSNFGEGYLYALNASDGTLLWRYPIGGQVISSPAVENGIVYIGTTKDKSTVALDAKTGTFLWNTTTDYTTAFRSSLSSPAVADGIVYIGSYDNNTYALDASTGTLLWNYTTGRWITSSPAVANGVVYIGSQDNNTYAFDAATGTLLWNYTTGGGITSSPAVANGVVYIGSSDGKVYAIGSLPEKPPASIGNLTNTTYLQDRITWTWTDPGSPDFSHVMVYLNGVFRENVAKGLQTWTATGLSPATSYTIGTRTVGTSGVINQTWVNHTARTAFPSGPGILWVASYPRDATIYLDGLVRGRTNRFVYNIPVGTHNLTLTKGGYQATTVMVAVPAGLKVLSPITLQPDGGTQGSGSLYVASYPTGATILIDGRISGLTDQIVSGVQAGDRNLTLEKTGYEPETLIVRVPAGDLRVLPPVSLDTL